MPLFNFAIVGCGNIGNRHAKYIAERGHLQAVCDIVPDKAKTLADAYHAKAYTSLQDLLEQEKNLDLLAVCTPNGLHAAHSLAGLEKGLHVVCEKPMAIRSDDCKRMIEAADRMKRHLFIVKQNRFNPPIEAVKKLIEEGRLGKILSVQVNCFWNRPAAYYQNSWKGTAELDGGTLFTQFSHFIDLLYWLLGEPDHVQAFIANLHHQDLIDFEDTGVINFHFANGILGGMHYTVNSFETNMEGSLTIMAENASIKIGGPYLNELSYQRIKDFSIRDLPAGNPANDYGAYRGTMSNHDKVYDNVIAVLAGHEKIATNAFEGLKTVEIIEKIYATAKAFPNYKK